MKIAVATRRFECIIGHAGKARDWLVFDWEFGRALAEPRRVSLEKADLFHHFQDDRPHPLDGVDLIVAGSAGDGFKRHMNTRGASVLLTGEEDPVAAVRKLVAGEPLADMRFDPTRMLCGVRDLFSRY